MSYQPLQAKQYRAVGDENASVRGISSSCVEPNSKRPRFALKPRHSSSANSNNCSCLGGVIPFGQPLKHDSIATVSLSESSSSSSSLESDVGVTRQPKRRASRRASFDEVVAVVPIPTRGEYSPHMRTRLWASPSEIVQNVARNLVEYTAEGCNWRTVMEDDDMFVCTSTGELIHPVHVRNVFGDVFGTKCPPPDLKMPQVPQVRVRSSTWIWI